MNENDWWNDLYGTAGPTIKPGGSAAPDAPGTRPDAEQQALVTVSPASAGTRTAAPKIPAPAHTWGSGRAPDPFLQQNPPHGAIPPDTTPEEAAELRRHEEKLGTDGTPVIPPKPTAPPAVPTPADETSLTPDTVKEKSEKGAATEEMKDKKDGEAKKEGDEEELRGVKALLAKFRERLHNEDDKDAENDKGEPEKEEKEPGLIRKSVHAVTERAVQASGGRWSFLWSMGAAWTISAQTLLTACDTVARIIGAPGITGSKSGEWHLFEGPGRWFRDVWQASWESGNPERLLFLGAIGVLPVTVMQFASRIESDGWRKALMWVGYGCPFIWAFSHSYIDSFGFRSWNDLYMSTLFATAWWGFWAAKDEKNDDEEEEETKNRTDFQKFLLRIPLASLMCGVFFYSPGAAF